MSLTTAIAPVYANSDKPSDKRDPAIEAQLDSMLGAGMYPQSRDEFEQILAMISDTTPVATYVRAWGYRALELVHAERDHDAAIELADRLIERALASNYPTAISEAYAVRIEVLAESNQRQQAIATIVDLDQWLPSVTDERVLFFTHNVAARVLHQAQHFEDALGHYLAAQEAIALNDGAQSLRRRQFLNLHIARLQTELEHFESAMELVEATLEEAKRQNVHHRIPELLLLKGYLQGNIPEHGPRESLITYAETIEWAERLDDTRRVLAARNNMGSVYIQLGEYDHARDVLLKALTIAETQNYETERQFVAFNLADIDVKQGNYEQGISQMREIIALTESAGRQRDYAEMMSYLAIAYGSAERYQEQAETLDELLQLRQRIFRAERDEALSELQARFEAQEKAQQITLLQQENIVQAQQIANTSLQRRIVFLFALSVILAALVLFFAYRSAQRTNKVLNETNESLKEQNLRDPLTQLANRRALQRTLDTFTAKADSESRGAMILIDIDHFKTINDNFGHTAGDEVLITIAQRLKQFIHSNDLVVRWGGEEFVIFMPDIRGRDVVEITRELLRLFAAQPVTFEQQNIPVSATAGVIDLPLQGSTLDDCNWEECLRLADSLLYLGKLHGRNQAHYLHGITQPIDVVKEQIFRDFDHANSQGWLQIESIPSPVSVQR
ncbi:tetratricopeptide repeat-containing diguanylate cyclase [Aliidiomarina halalkaliphila]|uniref:tetratricopeptide repeat-containing diguanylate cyclase n=1 Tax=Aliidiomarina halalkaliphila TaxID=2593535 RepID=UPI00163D7868|nr:tetratricopeptide repeat-containing diguanylate cyclase [Aliidiomarina halalkaliphila]